MAALWRGFLRLSLVSCPVELTPATSERSRITFNQLNQRTGNRVRQKLVDEQTGEDVERADIVKGYQVEKGRYVVIDEEKLKELQIDTSKIIDLDTFVDAAEIDRVYLDKPYYLAPDGPIAMEPFRVIARALRDKGKVGLGRVVIASREHMVAIEPYDGALLMTTMRAANEVRAPAFRDTSDDVSDEAVSLAGMIIDKRAATFEPDAMHDRYQDALRELVEETAKGHNFVTRQIPEPAQVIDLMAALKRSLGEGPKSAQQSPAVKGKKKVVDQRQRNLMLPVKGGKSDAAATVEKKRTTSRKTA
jgi:DNA end-binding protein Ku